MRGVKMKSLLIIFLGILLGTLSWADESCHSLGKPEDVLHDTINMMAGQQKELVKFQSIETVTSHIGNNQNNGLDCNVTRSFNLDAPNLSDRLTWTNFAASCPQDKNPKSAKIVYDEVVKKVNVIDFEQTAGPNRDKYAYNEDNYTITPAGEDPLNGTIAYKYSLTAKNTKLDDLLRTGDLWIDPKTCRPLQIHGCPIGAEVIKMCVTATFKTQPKDKSKPNGPVYVAPDQFKASFDVPGYAKVGILVGKKYITGEGTLTVTAGPMELPSETQNASTTQQGSALAQNVTPPAPSSGAPPSAR
jgi:hypothetical protein